MIARLPIRWRLATAFAVATIAVLVLAGLFTYLKVRSDLNEALNESLETRADDVAALVASGREVDPDLGAERLVEGEDSFTEVLTPGGRVVSTTLGGEPAPVLSASEIRRASAGTVDLGEREVEGIDGSARIVARPVSADGATSIVVVGATTQDRSEALAGLTGAFAIGGPLAAALAAAIGYLLAGRALTPVEAMRARASAITLDRSGERLPLPPADDELRRLGETLNRMLDRIESSLERERVFVADASHELRTPLAILRTELELAQRPGRSDAEVRHALESTAEEVDRLARLTEDLLVIARSDQGRFPVKKERVDLAELLERVRGRFADRAQRSGRGLVVGPVAGEAAVDPMRIEQALGNLIDNSLQHGEGRIELSAGSGEDGAWFEVRDEGPGFPGEFRARAFERFSRADAGRSGGGAGLGLAIVQAIAVAHGGSAEICEGPDASVRITVGP